MLGKRLLGLIGILFLGSQISLVASTEIPLCENLTITGELSNDEVCNQYNISSASYCLSGTNIQVLETTTENVEEVTETISAKCKVALTESKINIIKLDGTSTTIDNNLSDDISEDIEKYAIFNCGTDSCTPTVGIIKDVNSYYKIYKGESTNEKISLDGFDGTCSDNNIGELINAAADGDQADIKLCINNNLEGNSVELLDNEGSVENHNIMGVKGDGTTFNVSSDSPFNILADKSGIVIEVSNNYFVYDENKAILEQGSETEIGDCVGFIKDEVSDCDDNITINDVSGISYCIKGKNLYVLETTGESTPITYDRCKVALTKPKINIIKLEGKSTVIIDNTLSSNISTNEAYKNYAIFICDSTSCSQTVGIIKDEANYYGIKKGYPNPNTSSINEKIKVLNEPCTTTNVGGLVRTSLTDVELCLNESGNSVKLSSTKVNYLMAKGTNELHESSPFSVTSNIVIEVGQGYFVHDSNYGGAENGEGVEVYSDYSTSELIQRKVNFCSGNILNTLQTCKAGSCTVESIESFEKYLGGIKYLVEGKTYSCKSTSGTRKRASGTTKCNCLEFDESVNGLNAFIIDDDVDQTYATLIDDFTEDYTSNLKDIKLYSCNNGECKETNGYMKYGTSGSENIVKCTVGTVGTVGKCENYEPLDSTIDGTCNENAIGEIDFTAGKLCILEGESTYNYKVIQSKQSDEKDAKMYYVSIKNDTEYKIYKNEGKLIGEIVTENGYYLIDGKSQRITTVPAATAGNVNNKKKRNIVSRADESATAVMINCTDGSCTSQSNIAAGYYYNAGGKYIIKCAATASHSTTSETTTSETTASETTTSETTTSETTASETTTSETTASETTASETTTSETTTSAPTSGFRRKRGDVLEASDCNLVEVEAVGYYKTNDNTIVACTTKSKCDVVSYSYECDDSTIGKFIKYEDEEKEEVVAGLCLDEGVENYPGFVDSGEANYLIKYGANSIFINTIKKTTTTDNNYVEDIGIVKITKNSITIEDQKGLVCVTTETLAAVGGKCVDANGKKYYTCTVEGKCVDGIKNTCTFSNPSGCTPGYHLVDSNEDNYVTGTDENGKLYKCETANACNKISGKGYYIGGDDEIYSCDGTSVGCQIVTLEENTEESMCNGSDVEKLYKLSDGKKYICLSKSGIKAEIKDKGGRFLIEKNTNTDVNRKIFIQSDDSSNTHALITISKNEIILDTDYKTKSYLKYTYASKTNNEVLIRVSHADTETETCVNDISEYDCDVYAFCKSKETVA